MLKNLHLAAGAVELLLAIFLIVAFAVGTLGGVVGGGILIALARGAHGVFLMLDALKNNYLTFFGAASYAAVELFFLVALIIAGSLIHNIFWLPMVFQVILVLLALLIVIRSLNDKKKEDEPAERDVSRTQSKTSMELNV